MKLIARLVFGIIAGVAIGFVANEFIAKLMVTIKDVIGSFIFFMVPLIIVFFIAAGIAALGKGGGKMLGSTIFISYLSTILAGFFAVFVAMNVIPSLGIAGTGANAPSEIEGFLQLSVEPLFDVLTALLLAFVFGIGLPPHIQVHYMALSRKGKTLLN